MNKRTLSIDGVETPFAEQRIALAWPGVATFPGMPTTVAPIGSTPASLSIGVRVIGSHQRDRTTIAIAGRLEALARS